MIVNRVSRSDAVSLIRHCLENGEIRYGKHFKTALADEGVNIADAWTVLKSGNIYDEPEQDIKTGEWKYRVEGHEPSGKWLVIALKFMDENQTFLMTVFSIEARRKK